MIAHLRSEIKVVIPMWLIQNGNLTQIVVNPASTALTASSGRQIPWKPKLIPLLVFYTLSSEYIIQTNETG